MTHLIFTNGQFDGTVGGICSVALHPTEKGITDFHVYGCRIIGTMEEHFPQFQFDASTPINAPLVSLASVVLPCLVLQPVIEMARSVCLWNPSVYTQVLGYETRIKAKAHAAMIDRFRTLTARSNVRIERCHGERLAWMRLAARGAVQAMRTGNFSVTREAVVDLGCLFCGAFACKDQGFGRLGAKLFHDYRECDTPEFVEDVECFNGEILNGLPKITGSVQKTFDFDGE